MSISNRSARTYRFLPVFRLGLLICASVQGVRAQTWLGTSGTLWSANANWAGGVAPANNGSANVIFSQSNSSSPVLLDTSWNVAGVLFNTTPGMTAPTVAGILPTLGYNSPGTSSLTIQSGGITSNSTSLVTIVPALVAAQPQTWNIGSGGLLIYNLVTGAGSITKTGSGTLTLVNTQNSSTGGFGASAGTIIAATGGSLGADGSLVTLGGGSTLSFGYGSVSATTNAFNHPLTLNAGGGTITTTNGAATTLSGSIGGPGSLTFATGYKSSSTTASSYSLTGDNSYAGGTTVGGGVTVTISGTGKTLGTGIVTLQSGSALVLGSAANVAVGRTVTLQTNTADQYSSTVVLNDASITPTTLIDPASTGGVVALGNITFSTPLDFARIGNGQLWFGAGGTGTYAAVTLGADTDGVYRFGGGTSGTLTINGADNVLTGSRAVVVGETGVFQSHTIGTGSYGYTSVNFARANNYTGGTSLNLGTLVVGNDNALGSGSLTINSGSLQADGGPRTISNAVILNAATYGFNVRGPNNLTFAGPVDLNQGARTVSGGGLSGVTTFSNVISNGSLTLSLGTFTLSAANTLAGGLTVGGQSTVRVASDANLGAAGATLTISGGILTPSGTSLTIDRPVAIPYSQGAVATNGGTVTINGAITGNNTLTKRDTGTLVLTNPSDSTPLSVLSGTLQVDNAVAGKTSNGMQITVNSGGTLAGTGFVGYTSVSSGHIAPGDNGPGTLTIGSGLLLFGAPVLDFDLGTQKADKLVLADAHVVQFQGNSKAVIVVNVTDAGGLAPGQTYNLIDWGSAPTTGITASVFQLGSSPTGGTFTITASGVLQFTTVAYTPFQQWQSTYFGSINSTAAGPNANPAGDGIANLIKYALGLDPLHAAISGLPKVGTLPGYLTLTYAKPDAVTDILYTPQSSDDLVNWSNAGVAQEVLADDGTTQTVRVKVASTAVARRFLRLSVSAR